MPSSIYDTRRANLRQITANWGGPTKIALKLGYTNGSFVSQMAGPNPTKRISEDTAREIETKLELPLGWLDADNSAPMTQPGGLAPIVQTPPLDAGLLAEVNKAVLVAVENMGVKERPPIDKVADTMTLAYQHALATGRVDLTFVKLLVRLTK